MSMMILMAALAVILVLHLAFTSDVDRRAIFAVILLGAIGGALVSFVVTWGHRGTMLVVTTSSVLGVLLALFALAVPRWLRALTR